MRLWAADHVKDWLHDNAGVDLWDYLKPDDGTPLASAEEAAAREYQAAIDRWHDAKRDRFNRKNMAREVAWRWHWAGAMLEGR